ncbi:MAG: phosphomethylpyrimidine synthase ThiC [Acidobacteria bacterium]|nr:phosphomethylpyrimidine synthase ThiC [Acidobacteriota bacterium]
MSTLLEAAIKGELRDEFVKVAEDENKKPEEIMNLVASGEVVIPKNNSHDLKKIIGIGSGLRVKINANIGTSQDKIDLEEELQKMETAVKYGADAIMDLSTGGDIHEIRKTIISHSPVAIGTVPIYETMIENARKKRSLIKFDPEDLFNNIEKHGKDGVDFITVHCGLTMDAVNHLREQGRLTNIVSRGGCFTAEWMIAHKKENPLYSGFDRLLEIAHKYDMTLSLGDGLRPGCLADATDRAQIHELMVLGQLAQRAREAGVQVMIEGPGHVPLNQVETNIKIQKALCNNAPFYVLGPIVTDIAPGYDHITSAIGGAVAAMAGADFLCYVTPAEHLKLPDVQDVREGVIASRIAAHAADIAKGYPGAREIDDRMANYRRELDWEGMFSVAMDEEKAREFKGKVPSGEESVCSMCGEFCAIKGINRAFKNK